MLTVGRHRGSAEQRGAHDVAELAPEAASFISGDSTSTESGCLQSPHSPCAWRGAVPSEFTSPHSVREGTRRDPLCTKTGEKTPNPRVTCCISELGACRSGLEPRVQLQSPS